MGLCMPCYTLAVGHHGHYHPQLFEELWMLLDCRDAFYGTKAGFTGNPLRSGLLAA